MNFEKSSFSRMKDPISRLKRGRQRIRRIVLHVPTVCLQIGLCLSLIHMVTMRTCNSEYSPEQYLNIILAVK